MPPKRKRYTAAATLYRATTTFKRPRRQFAPIQRVGYGSIARTRGAAVTGEMKYFDAEQTGQNISVCTTTWVAGTMADPTSTINLGSAAVATPLCLFAPTVGAGLNQRIGRKVKMMKVKLNGQISVAAQAAQAAADAPCQIRLMLVMDKQSNAAQMTGAQLMNDGGAAQTTLNSFQNPNNFGRFRVLKERRFTVGDLNLVGSPTTADVVQAGQVYKWKMNMTFKKPVQVNFNATNGGTVADLIDNSLHIVVATSSAAYVPAIIYYSRVAFKE